MKREDYIIAADVLHRQSVYAESKEDAKGAFADMEEIPVHAVPVSKVCSPEKNGRTFYLDRIPPAFMNFEVRERNINIIVKSPSGNDWGKFIAYSGKSDADCVSWMKQCMTAHALSGIQRHESIHDGKTEYFLKAKQDILPDRYRCLDAEEAMDNYRIDHDGERVDAIPVTVEDLVEVRQAANGRYEVDWIPPHMFAFNIKTQDRCVYLTLCFMSNDGQVISRYCLLSCPGNDKNIALNWLTKKMSQYYRKKEAD